MDSKTLTYLKVALAALAVVAVTVLAALGKVDGASAVDFSKWILVTMLAGLGLVGASTALFSAVSKPADPTPAPSPPAEPKP